MNSKTATKAKLFQILFVQIDQTLTHVPTYKVPVDQEWETKAKVIVSVPKDIKILGIKSHGILREIIILYQDKKSQELKMLHIGTMFLEIIIFRTQDILVHPLLLIDNLHSNGQWLICRVVVTIEVVDLMVTDNRSSVFMKLGQLV